MGSLDRVGGGVAVMQYFRRPLIALGVAATLPTLVFASLQGFLALRGEQQAVRTQANAQVRQVNDLARAELSADLRLMTTVAVSPPLVSGNWQDFEARGISVLKANPWQAIVVTAPGSGAVVFGVRRQGEDVVAYHGPLVEAPPADLARPMVRGVSLEDGGKPVITLHVPIHDRTQSIRYVLTVLKDPAVFQDILARWAPPSGVSALVDREGEFVVRTVNPETRIGRPASTYLRAAVASGAPVGEYKGVTLEGVKNYTSYEIDPLTGWSTHVAYRSDLIDLPRSFSLVVALLGGLGALALGGVLTTLVLREMADRRKADESLRHAQKMEAVGRLTGGIAHDFNNLLTPIIGGLERVKARLGADERTHRIVDNALEAARRAAKLTSQLLAFSRSQRMEVGPVDVRAMLMGLRDLLVHSVGPDVRVEIVAPGGLGVMSDASQLELAIINLAVNARDAMPRGGVLTVSARAIESRGSADVPARAFIELSVADTGVGMTEEVRAKATEPFFTTKATGAGTGLGLAQVFAVADQSGGSVEIESAPGRGTIVHVRLPRAPDFATPPLIAHPRNGDPDPAPRGAVLVADDDAFVRAHIVDTLEAAGFSVLAASGAEEALKLLAARPVDLLVADFAMPGMNGAELIRAARGRQKSLRALIVSGYSDSAAIDAAAGDVRVLRKPFDVATLVNAVSEAIAR
jgi:signal transduction histidine kinase